MAEPNTYMLSPETRKDSFSDYLCLTAYKANTLQSRASIASGKGIEGKIKSWFIPMPQTVGRITSHNYESVETSFAYAIQKQNSGGGKRAAVLGDGFASTTIKTLESLVGAAISSVDVSGNRIGENFAEQIRQAVPQTLGNAAVDMIQSSLSMATDQPSIGMSNQELFYTGTLQRSYELAYEFTAKSELDIYGNSGVLQTIAELEAYSFPSTFSSDISNRDLINVPPIWTIKHALVNNDTGGVYDPVSGPLYAPLAYLGQPKLLVLYNVSVAHDVKVVAKDSSGWTYPFVTSMKLTFAEMEPVVRYDGDRVGYGGTNSTSLSAPRLMTRSEVYAEFKSNGAGFANIQPATGGQEGQ